ncbi:hypothetical protein BVX99_02235, partial [bacterium F16]
RMNMLLFMVHMVLLAIGVAFIYSIGQQSGGHIRGYWIRQVIWILMGGGLMALLMGVDYRHLGRFSLIIFGGSLLLLIAVLLFGKVINGARCWLVLPMGVTVQPAEFAKLGLIIPLAWYAAFQTTDFKRYRDIAYCCALTLIPMTLILLQPDMGSCLVFAPICLVILFLGGLRIRLLIMTAIIGMLVGPMVYKFCFKYHQKQRVLVYLRPLLPEKPFEIVRNLSISNKTRAIVMEDDWNAKQCELATGSGGLYGKGFGKGTQNPLGFLPKKITPTDFIFSVISEETGFLGSAFLLACCGVMVVLSLHISAKSGDDFGKYLAAGIATVFCIHIFINIGMTIRVMPIIGIPLPFVSYGGSGMIGMMACMGVLQSVYIHRHNQ